MKRFEKLGDELEKKFGWYRDKGWVSCEVSYYFRKNGMYAILDCEGLTLEGDECIFDSLTIKDMKGMSAKDVHEWVIKRFDSTMEDVDPEETYEV